LLREDFKCRRHSSKTTTGNSVLPVGEARERDDETGRQVTPDLKRSDAVGCGSGQLGLLTIR
jgi:hypothetical protein